MKAVQVKAYVNVSMPFPVNHTTNNSQSPEELQVTTVPDVKQNTDEYLIEVKACAANFFDTLQIRGKYQWVCLPFAPLYHLLPSY